jgi:DNA-binding MarR family transcriptional regulator
MNATAQESGAASVSAIGGDVDQLVQLLKLASLISRPMRDGVSSPNGLSVNELSIVMGLGGEGEMAGHDISEKMAIPPMNVSRSLAALLERGWIEPVPDASNRRRKPVRLSEAGWAAYRAMTPDIARVAEQLLGGLTARERTGLAQSVEKIIDHVEGWPAR